MAILINQRFSIHQRLGSGGHSSVFLAKDHRYNQMVALKMMNPSQHSNAVREFELLFSLNHSNLIKIHELFMADQDVQIYKKGQPYFSCEYIEGSSPVQFFQRYTNKETFPLALTFLAQMASACDHIHHHGLIHGDIKPDNIRIAKRDDQHIHATLLDLGYSRPAGKNNPKGSMRYMSPEALTGNTGPRSDLYSLGATFFECITGQPLFPQEDSQSLLSAILEGSQKHLQNVTLDWPTPIAELLATLLAKEEKDRPSSAKALLDNIKRIQESLNLPIIFFKQSNPLVPPIFVGRHKELHQLENFLTSLQQNPQESRILEIVGDKDSGRKRLLQEALLRDQINCAKKQRQAVQVYYVKFSSLWKSHTSKESWVDNHKDAPTLIVIEEDDDTRVLSLLKAIPTHLSLIIISREKWQTSGHSLLVPSLPQGQALQLMSSLSNELPPTKWQKEAIALCHALPGMIVMLMKLSHAIDPYYEHPPAALFTNENLSAGVLHRIEALPSNAKTLLEFLAIYNASLPISRIGVFINLLHWNLLDSVQTLVQSGLANTYQDTIQCASKGYIKSIISTLSTKKKITFHHRILEKGKESLPVSSQAIHHLAIGNNPVGAELALQGIEEYRKKECRKEALQLCLSSKKAMSRTLQQRHATETSEVAMEIGQYEIARQYAKIGQKSSNKEERLRCTLVNSRLLLHSGNTKKAISQIKGLIREFPRETICRAHLARALLSKGQWSQAENLAHAILSSEPQPNIDTSFLCHEVIGLACLYQGKMEDSRKEFVSLCNDTRNPKNGRALGLYGMYKQCEGSLVEAADLYKQAAQMSIEVGLQHSAAVFRLNAATISQRTGQYSDALQSFSAALRDLTQSATPFELSAAHCNRGNVLLVLGELKSAKNEAKQAYALAQKASKPRILFYALLLNGDIAQRQSKHKQSLGYYQQAYDIALQHSLSSAPLALASVLRNQSREAPSICWQDLSSIEKVPDEHHHFVMATKARIALQIQHIDHSFDHQIDSICDQLHALKDLDLAWKLAVLSAQLYQQSKQLLSFQKALTRAKEISTIVLQQTPEAYRRGLRNHPDFIVLTQMLKHKTPPLSAPQQINDNNQLRRLLTLGRRLNSERNIESLLDEIIDTAIELGRAERAFLLLRGEDDVLEIRIARNINQEDLASTNQLSRSIAEKVANTGQTVLTVDAEHDGRFRASRSIAAMQLRSILAVPFRVKNRVVGTLYLDHRFRKGAFDEASVELVCELAEIAAIALENARLHSENHERKKEIDRLNARLQDQLEETQAKLLTAQAKIPKNEAIVGFESIIGNSTAIRDSIQFALRATACDLPVVIFGESGTGKEIMAKAIHANSDRSKKPFVAINCGAVPDSLLEAELFGHKKGAFTGARESRKGLFRIADGGTLFLDEITDTSLAMQGKLLRALQEGEIRPLGSETVEFVDIRILCASNTKLKTAVEAGLFREDLFYRLHVLALNLPPLRSRVGDIPLLSRFFLKKIRPAIQISDKAMQALEGYSWPGNVRQLENELTRTVALLATGSMINPSDLSAEVLQENVRIQNIGGEEEGLSLKPQVESLERKLITQAMTITAGNQSQAAKLLGLSRYGLQKKLQRFSMNGPWKESP